VRLPEPFIFLIDRCLGTKAVPDALTPALLVGERLVLLDDHFEPDTQDAIWIPEAGAKRWVVVTKDTAMRRNPLEIGALLASKTAVFFFANAGLTGPKVGEALALALPGMRTAMRRFKVPLMGRVSVSGELSILHAAGETLKPPKVIKVRRGGRG
jgi:hypothetical protein